MLPFRRGGRCRQPPELDSMIRSWVYLLCSCTIGTIPNAARTYKGLVKSALTVLTCGLSQRLQRRKHLRCCPRRHPLMDGRLHSGPEWKCLRQEAETLFCEDVLHRAPFLTCRFDQATLGHVLEVPHKRGPLKCQVIGEFRN